MALRKLLMCIGNAMSNFLKTWRTMSVEAFSNLGNKVLTGSVFDALAYQSKEKYVKTILISGKFWAGLQPNHLALLEHAMMYYKTHLIILAFNSTKSLYEFHGFPQLGFYNDFDRAEIFSHMLLVDFVCWFDEKTPVELCKKLHPDILLKGEDWRGKDIPEETFCGDVEFVRLEKEYHTSDKIRKPWDTK